MEKFRFTRKRVVYPDARGMPPAPAPPPGKARYPAAVQAYGAWCAPDPSLPPPDVSQETPLSEKSKPMEYFRLQKLQSFLPQRFKFLPSSSSHPYSSNSSLDFSGPDLTHEKLEKLLEHSNKAASFDGPDDNGKSLKPQEAGQELEMPQSPVPSSPIRKKAFLKMPIFCNPFTPMDPQGCGYICWLLLVTFCYAYNAWAIPLRTSFPYQTPENTYKWLIADYCADIVYLIDVVFIKPMLMYLHEGFWVDDPVETRRNYRTKIQYKFDIISLIPLDVLYIYFGTDAVLLRLPRLLKLQTFWEFHVAMDRVVSSPYLVRIGKTLFYIFFLIHINACAYYSMSVYEGLGSNGWVFDGVGHAYIRCFYFSTKTATSIGKNPKPENEIEYMFMTVAWLMGVFVFALLISQIRDIIATATRAQTEYRKRVDTCSRFMRKLNLEPMLQKRVFDWFSFAWKEQRCFDESSVLDSLPFNMKRDVALEIHMSTLSKVQVFKDCDTSLLRDLVMQMRSTSFLPGDAVCRAGDVGHHMYIVKQGECCVLSADEKHVLATLREGSVFGEIALLGFDGARRRTATVRSRGYSNLFALSKHALDNALEQHPEAAAVLRKRADQIMKENAARRAQQKVAEEQRRAREARAARRASGNCAGFGLDGTRRRSRPSSSQSKPRLSAVSEIENEEVKDLPLRYSYGRTIPSIVLTSPQ